MILWFLVSALGVLALAAAMFHRALSAASPARLEELNIEQGAYRSLPDLDDAVVAAAWFKIAVYAAFVTTTSFAVLAERAVTAGVFAATAAASVAALVACEALALVIVGFHSGRLFYRILPLVAAFAAVGVPILAAAGVLAGIVARISGHEAPPGPEQAAHEDILDAVTEGAREGVIESQERDMIESIIEFKDAQVSKIMTPRTELFTVPADANVAAALETAIRSGHSRLPVCTGTADNVVGVLYVKDVLRVAGSPLALTALVTDVMRSPHFVPETKSIKQMLQEFRATNVHMAIVLDEYGGTSGIVTIEDILEEIVGEIEDEYDAHEASDIHVVSRARAIVEGSANLREVNSALAVALPENEEYETIAGFVLFRIGRIPAPGETFELDCVRFKVLDADDRRVKRMSLEVIRGSGDIAVGEAK